jgi:signal transduction histidine kinase
VSAEIHLSIHNILAVVSSIVTLGLTLFTYLNGRHKLANILLACQFLSIAVFLVSHVMGVNVRSPELSKTIFMFNLANFFIAAFNLHVVFVLIGKEKEKRYMVNFVYISAIVLSVLFLLFPVLFLLPSVPKMYFPNYYEPGILNWTRVVFVFVLIIPYAIHELYKGYRRASSDLEKKRLKFFILTMIFGYSVGILPNLLVYNLPVDPLLGMPFALFFTIPFIYGAVQYELLNVKVIAKQAFWYSLAVFSVGGVITLFNLVTNQINNLYAGFPTWVISLVSSIVAVAIAVLVWKKMREGDLLKYEFITIATHKFRTPITVIKWSADVLTKEKDEDKHDDTNMDTLNDAD